MLMTVGHDKIHPNHIAVPNIVADIPTIYCLYIYIMWVKQCYKPSLSHHHFYRWYAYHSQSWVAYDIVLPCFTHIKLGTTYVWTNHETTFV